MGKRTCLVSPLTASNRASSTSGTFVVFLQHGWILVLGMARFFKSPRIVSIVTSRSDYDDEVDDTADISATNGLNIGILYSITT